LRATVAVVISLFCVVSATAQGQRPPMAEEVFKNVPVIRGIPVDEFMDTMGMFAAALSLNCTDCHKTDDWAAFAEETPLKQTARRMVLMVNTINRTNFGGRKVVTCYTCHRGDTRPKVAPSLTLQYGVPFDDPNEVEIFNGTNADEIFNRYIQAVGGAQRLAAFTGFTARGTYSGYDTDQQEVPVDVYAKAPNQRTTIVHMVPGDSVRTFDGREGWIAAPDKPTPLMPLTGGNVEGAKIEAMLAFPPQIRQAYSQWRVNSAIIDDKDVKVVQGTNPNQLPINLYFDDESGLLVRVLRFTDTMVGRVPTQIDFTDYRDVAGVKVPFEYTVTWTNGQAITKFTDVQANGAIPATRFAKPAPAPPPKLQ
jgi:photosynthetic reaction center cytochrome c subunit